MIKRFAVYTETKPNLEKMTGIYFKGYTMEHCTGWFKAQRERVSVITIMSEAVCGQPYLDVVNKLHELCQAIKTENNQDEVLLSEEDIVAYRI